MASSQDVNVSKLSDIVQSVQKVVARFYGPQCQQTLLTSQTGQAVITSDGLTILDSLQPSHPVAVLVSAAVRNCLRHTQDGCKIFFLYLSAILKGLQSHIDGGSFCHSGTSNTADKRILNLQGGAAAARCFPRLNQEMLPEIHDKMLLHSLQLYTSLRHKVCDVDILKNICRTTLAPHYNPILCDFFSLTLVKYCTMNGILSMHDMHKHLRFSLDHFGLLCIKVPNMSYTECTVLSPLLIRRDFAVKTDHILEKKSVKTLLLSTAAESDDERPVRYSVREESSISELMHQRRKVAENFVHRCAVKGVDLIICSEAVPGFILDKFRCRNISVIVGVLQEDIGLMEQLTGKFSVCWYDDINESPNLIMTEGIQRLGLGGHLYLHVKIKPLVMASHLIVCAPTVGLCDQAAMALQKSFTSMLLCFSDHSDAENVKNLNVQENTCAHGFEQIKNQMHQLCISSNLDDILKFPDTDHELRVIVESSRLQGECSLSIVEGGGGFELLLSKLISQYGGKCGNKNLSIVCEVLADSVMFAVKVLYENTAFSDSCSGYLEVKQALQGKLNEGTLWGLSRRGSLCDVKEKGVLESLASKLHVFSCVLRLVEQLLRTDKIVSVKKLGS